MLVANPPKFITFFICLILIIICATVIWMWCGEIDEVVRATGVLRPINNVSTVRNVISGCVDALLVTDGQRVDQGEVLFSIDTELADSQLTGAVAESEVILENITKLQRMRSQINDCMIGNEHHQLHEVNESDHKFQLFLSRYNQLLLNCDEARIRYEQECRVNSLPDKELEKLRLAKEAANFALESYIYDTLTNIDLEIQTKNERLRILKNQIRELEQTKALSVVRAPISGTVQMLQSVNKWDFLPAGIELLRIVPEYEYLRVEIYVHNEDIGKIRLGQEISYLFHALPYRQFGMICGSVTSIADDAIATDEQMPAFKITGTLNKAVVQDRTGNTFYFKAGMICESRIRVRQEKIIFMALRKLDFRF